MSETEPIVLFGERIGQSRPRSEKTTTHQSNGRRASTPEVARSFSGNIKAPPYTSFDRKELNTILGVYGRKVADGEWRDYAIHHDKDHAVFSIFRRTSEMPLYRVEKQPKLARRQGAYSVVNAAGMVLRRGHDLAQVLKIIDRRPRLVSA